MGFSLSSTEVALRLSLSLLRVAPRGLHFMQAIQAVPMALYFASARSHFSQRSHYHKFLFPLVIQTPIPLRQQMSSMKE
jgi:hypothetical protein